MPALERGRSKEMIWCYVEEDELGEKRMNTNSTRMIEMETAGMKMKTKKEGRKDKRTDRQCSVPSFCALWPCEVWVGGYIAVGRLTFKKE